MGRQASRNRRPGQASAGSMGILRCRYRR
jgi:hypothetical protein